MVFPFRRFDATDRPTHRLTCIAIKLVTPEIKMVTSIMVLSAMMFQLCLNRKINFKPTISTKSKNYKTENFHTKTFLIFNLKLF